MKNIKKNRFIRGLRKHSMSLLFVSPFVILFTVFMVIPSAMALYLSFTEYDILNAPTFVGLTNYLTLFLKDEIFLIALKNTILYALIYSPIAMLLNMGVAWIINDYSQGLRTFLTYLFYAPCLLGGMGSMWGLILSGDAYGFLNKILLDFGFITSPIQWTTDTDYMFVMWIIIALTSSLGTGFLTFIAALKTLDSALYEAAAIDGIKNRFQEVWYITLPTLKPQFSYMSITAITGAFGATSSTIFGNPSTDYAVHTVTQHLSDYSNERFEYGMACAIAVVLFILTTGTNTLFLKFIKRVGD